MWEEEYDKEACTGRGGGYYIPFFLWGLVSACFCCAPIGSRIFHAPFPTINQSDDIYTTVPLLDKISPGSAGTALSFSTIYLYFRAYVHIICRIATLGGGGWWLKNLTLTLALHATSWLRRHGLPMGRLF